MAARPVLGQRQRQDLRWHIGRSVMTDSITGLVVPDHRGGSITTKPAALTDVADALQIAQHPAQPPAAHQRRCRPTRRIEHEPLEHGGDHM